MIRINLLPPEIIQKRRDESRWKWVWLGALLTTVVLALFYMFMFVQVTLKASEVAAAKQEAEQLQGTTQRFAIFQQKENDLVQRKAIVATAGNGRVDWARLLNEMSMMLPTDVYLTSLSAQEPGDPPSPGGSLNLGGSAIDQPQDSPDNGFKSLAKMLVRLTEIGQLGNVWLNSVQRAAPSGGTASTTSEAGGATQPMITWSLSALIESESATNSAGVPAPPPPPAP